MTSLGLVSFFVTLSFVAHLFSSLCLSVSLSHDPALNRGGCPLYIGLFLPSLHALYAGRAWRQLSDAIPGVRKPRGRLHQRDGRRVALRQSRAQHQEQSGEIDVSWHCRARILVCSVLYCTVLQHRPDDMKSTDDNFSLNFPYLFLCSKYTILISSGEAI